MIQISKFEKSKTPEIWVESHGGSFWIEVNGQSFRSTDMSLYDSLITWKEWNGEVPEGEFMSYENPIEQVQDMVKQWKA